MTRYDSNTCYWCGGPLPRDDHGRTKTFSSFATDTLSTSREFCSNEHCQAFLEYCKANQLGQGMHFRLPPYWGAKIERMAKAGKVPVPPKVPEKKKRIPTSPAPEQVSPVPDPNPTPVKTKEFSHGFPEELKKKWTKEDMDAFVARITKK